MPFRIVTWNVDGFRDPFRPKSMPWSLDSTYHNRLFHDLTADILVLTEIKFQRKHILPYMVHIPDWDSYWSFTHNRPGELERIGFSGLAVYTRSTTCSPICAEEGITGIHADSLSGLTIRRLPPHRTLGGHLTKEDLKRLNLTSDHLASLDAEGRCLMLGFPGFILIAINCPDNMNWPYRNDFVRVLCQRITNLSKEGKSVIVAGNIGFPLEPTDTHFYQQRLQFHQTTPEGWMSLDHRRTLNRLIRSDGVPRRPPEDTAILVDVCRFFHPGIAKYTYWKPGRKTRQDNRGERHDYILISSQWNKWVSRSNIMGGVWGSTHCPVYVDFKDRVFADTHILDLVNPFGMFRDGVRRHNWDNRCLLPRSAKRWPELYPGYERPSLHDTFIFHDDAFWDLPQTMEELKQLPFTFSECFKRTFFYFPGMDTSTVFNDKRIQVPLDMDPPPDWPDEYKMPPPPRPRRRLMPSSPWPPIYRMPPPGGRPRLNTMSRPLRPLSSSSAAGRNLPSSLNPRPRPLRPAGKRPVRSLNFMPPPPPRPSSNAAGKKPMRPVNTMPPPPRPVNTMPPPPRPSSTAGIGIGSILNPKSPPPAPGTSSSAGIDIRSILNLISPPPRPEASSTTGIDIGSILNPMSPPPVPGASSSAGIDISTLLNLMSSPQVRLSAVAAGKRPLRHGVPRPPPRPPISGMGIGSILNPMSPPPPLAPPPPTSSSARIDIRSIANLISPPPPETCHSRPLYDVPSPTASTSIRSILNPKSPSPPPPPPPTSPMASTDIRSILNPKSPSPPPETSSTASIDIRSILNPKSPPPGTSSQPAPRSESVRGRYVPFDARGQLRIPQEPSERRQSRQEYRSLDKPAHAGPPPQQEPLPTMASLFQSESSARYSTSRVPPISAPGSSTRPSASGPSSRVPPISAQGSSSRVRPVPAGASSTRPPRSAAGPSSRVPSTPGPSTRPSAAGPSTRVPPTPSPLRRESSASSSTPGPLSGLPPTLAALFNDVSTPPSASGSSTGGATISVPVPGGPNAPTSVPDLLYRLPEIPSHWPDEPSNRRSTPGPSTRVPPMSVPLPGASSTRRPVPPPPYREPPLPTPLPLSAATRREAMRESGIEPTSSAGGTGNRASAPVIPPYLVPPISIPLYGEAVNRSAAAHTSPITIPFRPKPTTDPNAPFKIPKFTYHVTTGHELFGNLMIAHAVNTLKTFTTRNARRAKAKAKAREAAEKDKGKAVDKPNDQPNDKGKGKAVGQGNGEASGQSKRKKVDKGKGKGKGRAAEESSNQSNNPPSNPPNNQPREQPSDQPSNQPNDKGKGKAVDDDPNDDPDDRDEAPPPEWTYERPKDPFYVVLGVPDEPVLPPTMRLLDEAVRDFILQPPGKYDQPPFDPSKDDWRKKYQIGAPKCHHKEACRMHNVMESGKFTGRTYWICMFPPREDGEQPESRGGPPTKCNFSAEAMPQSYAQQFDRDQFHAWMHHDMFALDARPSEPSIVGIM